MTTHATGTFTFADWDEHPLGEAEGGARLARATVTNHFSGAVTAESTSCQYSIVYRADKTGEFSGHELLVGSLHGRTGSFVLAQQGTFGEDGTVHSTFAVLDGSGSGELTGLAGTGTFIATHGEKAIPYSFDYTLG